MNIIRYVGKLTLVLSITISNNHDVGKMFLGSCEGIVDELFRNPQVFIITTKYSAFD